MTQQDDITQRVLTDDEIQALWDEACKDSPQAPGWNRHIRFARALLSKVSAPIADSTLPLEQALHELIDKIVPGLDTGDLVQDARRASTDLSAILASAPVAGEAQGWSGWACQYPNKLPRLYGSIEIARLNCDAANGDRVLFLSEHAAPQASAEGVHNAALEEAAHLMEQTGKRIAASDIRALKTQADKDGCTCPSGDGSLRHPCPMHPGADKDGGQQPNWISDWSAAIKSLPMGRTDAEGIRSPSNACMHRNECRAMLDRQERGGEVDVDRLMAAAKGMTRLYSYVWDRTDGCLVVFPENVRAFDEAFDALRMATGEAVDDAPQAEQGERDA